MSQREKQKSLLIDPSNILHFNVAHENIHMKKVKETSNTSSPNQTPRSMVSQKVYYSIVEKQSESGISFNNRLFFLKDEDSFGYMSTLDFNFQVKNAKEAVPLKNLRKVIPKGKILTLMFQSKPVKQGQKAVQKKWILRMKDKKMADAWTDIINYQVGQIPSRKSTIQKPQNLDESNSKLFTPRNFTSKEQQKLTTAFSRMQQPVSNERPELNYLSVMNNQTQTNPSKNIQRSPITPKSIDSSPGMRQIAQSPQKEEQQQSRSRVQLSPQQKIAQIYERSENDAYQSTSQKHSQKKQSYLSSDRFVYNSEFVAQKSQFQQLEHQLNEKIQELKQKLYLSSFINYFRPHLDEQVSKKKKNYLKEIDQRYEDFITYCEIIAKQLIDSPLILNQFRLSNRLNQDKQSIPKQKFLKHVSSMYENVFGKNVSNFMSVQSLTLLFDNIIYVNLQDVQIIIPVAQLKTIPGINQSSIDNASSTNKICQNSLVAEFQNKQKNLQYVYNQIMKEQVLKSTVLIPMTCQVEYKGFNLFFRIKINENLINTKVNFDSSIQIQALTPKKRNTAQINELSLQAIHQKLSQVLNINVDVLQNDKFFRMQTLMLKRNPLAPSAIITKEDYKYVILHCDILPHLDSKQIVNEKIFTIVHQSGLKTVVQDLGAQNNSQLIRTTKKSNQTTSQIRISSSALSAKNTSSQRKRNNLKLAIYNHLGSTKQNEFQIRQYKLLIQKKIKQVTEKLDRFDISIIHPYQMSQLLDQHFLNHYSWGRICQQISGKNTFVKSIIKSEIAAECVKIILFKKLQEIILSQKYINQTPLYQAQSLKQSITLLLNLILGTSSTKQTQLIWKVLTLHSQVLYGASVSQQQIHKGYFMLALVSKLNIIVNPNFNSLHEIFKVDKYFANVKFDACRAQSVKISSKILQELQKENLQQILQQKEQKFKTIAKLLQISQNQIPYFIKRSKALHNRILILLAEIINPSQHKFNHLGLWQPKSLNFSLNQSGFGLVQQTKPAQNASALIKQKQLNLKTQFFNDNFTLYYQRRLKQLGHKIKQKPSLNVDFQVDLFMKEIKIFYENHPIISQFYEFLSDVYVYKEQFQKALEFGKLSLSNMISVCEGNTNHIKLSSCFAKNAYLNEKMGRFELALNQMKRTKHCLQTNKEDKSVQYATQLIKIAKIGLVMEEKINESLSSILSAKQILQRDETILNNPQLLVECYELQSSLLSRSDIDFNALKSQNGLDLESRAIHYFETLEKILRHQNLLNKETNKKKELVSQQVLQRFLRVVVPYYFHFLSDKGGEMFMAYLCEISENIARKGGIDYNPPSSIGQNEVENEQMILMDEKQIQSYPLSKAQPSSVSQEPNQQLSQQQPYNMPIAFQFIKQQILKGQFIIKLMLYIQKAQQILLTIKNQIKQNKINRSQSRSSSFIYLMSSRDQNQAGKEEQNSNDRLEKSINQSQVGLQELLDYTKQGRDSTEKDFHTSYSVRERNFDSLIRALVVLLGDGFMLHVFEE